jgi:ankyrin repeat protein
MSEQTPGSASAALSLPDAPNLDWLRKQAKRQLGELRKTNPTAQLADAQFDLAKQYGFASWRALKAHVESLTVNGQLFDAAKEGDVGALSALLDQHPEKLYVRNQPYEHTLLHLAAFAGHLAAVDLLLKRGLDVNAREKGDNTYAMHWAVAAGHLDVVRRLADAGGDVVGHGDDHELGVIGWATCWDGADDPAHRAVVDFLLSRGARHHIFSAIAMNLAGEVRRIVAADPSALNRRMSRNENNQLPLHFAVRMNRPEMVALLLELGADPLAVDGSGMPAAVWATSPDIDRGVMQAIRVMTSAELLSAERGHRPPRAGPMDLVATLALGDWEMAERLVRENPELIERGHAKGGVLHMMAKRGDAAAVKWLLDHGADPNARWAHWDADVTPLHLAAMEGQADVVRALLAGGADPSIRDSKHDGDAIGWADFFKRKEIVQILEATRRSRRTR